MRFTKAVDVWALSDDERRRLQPGQWVFCGEPQYLGRFYAQSETTTVVAHLNGHRKGWPSYCRTIRDYGRSLTKRGAR